MALRPMKPERAAILLVLAILGACVTVPKLNRMYVVTGRLPGAQTCRATVAGKRYGPPRPFERRVAAYPIRWVTTTPGLGSGEQGEDQVARGEWEHLQIGMPIGIVRVPGERRWFYRHSIYVSAGNFAFDYVLLATETLVAVYAIWSLYRFVRDPLA